MTNFEKYKGAEERREAFKKVYHDSFYTGIDPFDWLELEAEEEKPLPCPFCHAKVFVYTSNDQSRAECSDCQYSSRYYDSRAEAITSHNRVAKAVMDAKAKEVKK